MPAPATAPIVMRCASPTATSLTTIRRSTFPVTSTRVAMSASMSAPGHNAPTAPANFPAFPAKANGADAPRRRNASDTGKRNAAAEPLKAAAPLIPGKPDQRKMPERRHRPAFKDFDAAVARHPFGNPLPAEFRPPAEPPRQRREQLLAGS